MALESDFGLSPSFANYQLWTVGKSLNLSGLQFHYLGRELGQGEGASYLISVIRRIN